MTSLALTVLGVLVNQPRSIYTVQRASKTVYAAQAGLQVALGQIRTATAAPDAFGKVYGSKAKLPCTLSGSVDGSSDSTSYSVTLSYFTSNPAGQSAAWQAANRLSCSSPGGLAITPAFALIASQGTATSIAGLPDSVANRAVQGIYAFDVTNVNIPGDLILDGAQGYCLYAVSASVGSLVTYQPVASCTADTLDKWVYTTSYQIQLASTVGTPLGLCVTGPTRGNASQDAVLEACRTGSSRWNQLWSWTGSYTWFGQNDPIANGNSGFCLGSGQGNATNLTGKYLQVIKNCGVSGTFYPKSGVGAGGASTATKQLVNYKEFGRCADVTNQDYTSAFYITYPCKQDPTGTNSFTWNQQFNFTEPTLPATSVSGIEIWTNNGNVGGNPRQCLTSNGTNYPKLTNCTTTPTAAQAWTRYYDTGSYSNSYIITDLNGKCLGVDPTTTYNGWSAMTVTACDTTTAQKWNAKPQSTTSTFGSFKEIG
ncbi:MAG: ricin-type beta-trefoil lectin domain protein [Micrococcales bacterium]|nr:ricin-type beta-trefoil lectin domain protein [Micrococcales bacterium]